MSNAVGSYCQGTNGYAKWCNENFHCNSGKCSLWPENKCASTENGPGAWCNRNYHCKSAYCHPWQKCS